MGCCCAGLKVHGVPNNVPDPPPLCNIILPTTNFTVMREALRTRIDAAVNFDPTDLEDLNDETWNDFNADEFRYGGIPYQLVPYQLDVANGPVPRLDESTFVPGPSTLGHATPHFSGEFYSTRNASSTAPYSYIIASYCEQRAFAIMPLIVSVGGTRYSIRDLYSVSALALVLSGQLFGGGYTPAALNSSHQIIKSYTVYNQAWSELELYYGYVNTEDLVDVNGNTPTEALFHVPAPGWPRAIKKDLVVNGLTDIAPTLIDTFSCDNSDVGNGQRSFSSSSVDISGLVDTAPGGDYLVFLFKVPDTSVVKKTPTIPPPISASRSEAFGPTDVVVRNPLTSTINGYTGVLRVLPPLGVIPSIGSVEYDLVKIWPCILALNTRINIEDPGSTGIVEEDRLKTAQYLSGTGLAKRFRITDNTTGGGGGQTTDTFNTSGTWTVPAGVTQVTVECWGRGGFGGSMGGGGGGAYARGVVSVTPGANEIVSVGGSGFPDSWFRSTGTLRAAGGGDGTAGGGGIGGTASGSALDVGFSGGDGGSGVGATAGGGGGGAAGAAGAGGNGGDASGATPGTGGTGVGDPPDTGDGGDGGTPGNDGDNGSLVGGGGGQGSTTGGNGRVKLTYTPQLPAVTRTADIFLAESDGSPYSSGDAYIAVDYKRQSNPNDANYYIEPDSSNLFLIGPVGEGTSYETIGDLEGVEFTFNHDGDDNVTPANGTVDATVKITFEHISISNALP